MAPALGYRTTALEALQDADLTGKVAIVTGGNSGIGVETARALSHAGADVVICSRSAEAGEKVAQEIRAGNVKGKVSVKPLDLADLASIKQFANTVNAELPRLDILVLNAGVMACPLTHTTDGFEMQIGVNHIGHFDLTQQLLPKLKKSGTAASPARVVAVASEAHRMGSINVEDLNYETRKYSSWGAYGQAKLANCLFASELAKRMETEGAAVKAFSLHPGVINTNLQRHMGIWSKVFTIFSPFMKTIPQGAATSVYAAASPEVVETANGKYLSDCKIGKPTKAAQDNDMAAKLWVKTEELLAKAKAARGL